jgi:Subtilase family
MRFLNRKLELKIITIKNSLCILVLLPALALAGAVDTPHPQGESGGGFGLSIDLGTLLKVAKSLAGDTRYQSPDTKNLAKYEAKQLILSWDIAKQGQVIAALKASGFNLQNSVELRALGLSVGTIKFASENEANVALKNLRELAKNIPSLIADHHAIAYPMQAAAESVAPEKQYAYALVNAIAVPKLTNAVNVGIVDTEITNASALAVSSIKTKRIFANTDKPAASDHGNAVAAIISANGNGFEGLAQGANLRAAGVMREVAPGINATNTLLIAQALDWLVSEKVQVTNLSLGSASDEVLAAVITKSQEGGMVLVAAAGNGGALAPASYPAAYPNVIAVTAVDSQKHLYARANQGAYIVIAAPGVDVWAPVNADLTKGKLMSGTSFASPFVAAAVVRQLSESKGETSNAQQYIQKLCAKSENLGTKTTEFGCGLLRF